MVINFFGRLSPAFNLADIVQFIGVGLIFVLQFSPAAFDNKYADKLWVSRQFQKRYSLQLVSIGFFLVLVFGALSYSFVKVVLNELSAVDQIKQSFMQDYLIFFISLASTFLLFLF